MTRPAAINPGFAGCGPLFKSGEDVHYQLDTG
jgi:hypothetical protein